MIGRSLGGYDVLSLIGRGATGTVYLAWDKSLRRHAALKVLLGGLANDPTMVKSLRLEARAAAPLRHPNVVRIYAAGVENGTPYIAMEYVDGEPLDRFLKRSGSINWANAFFIGLQVCEALRYIHSKGVIHRDVKPANVLLDRQGRARLTDFGIANIQTEEGDLPEAAGFLGTPHYMSPEQCEGREVSFSTDLYSLGVTLHQMISGQLPFMADTPMSLVKSIVSDPVPRLNRIRNDVPDDVARLVAHLLEKHPQERPPNAEVVCLGIEKLLESNGGMSAMPSALNAFIREQARLSPTATPPPRSKAAEAHDGTVLGRIRAALTGKSAKVAASVAFMLACAAVPLGAWSWARAADRAVAAPMLDRVRFERLSPSLLVAHLGSDAFYAGLISWTGAEAVALVRTEGFEGTLTQGSTGVMALDPENMKAWSVRPPTGAVVEGASKRPAVVELGSAPRNPTMVVRAPATSGGDDTGASLLTQRWDEAWPRSAVLYREPSGPDPLLGAPSRIVGATRHPDGNTVLLVLRSPAQSTCAVAERDVRWSAEDRLGPRLDSGDGNVVPESVRYTPDGKSIFFLVDKAESQRELWAVPHGGQSAQGKRILSGNLARMIAVSPDNRRVALALRTVPTEDRHVVIVDAGTGEIETDLGIGAVGPNAWEPAGRFLVITALDAAGSDIQRATAVEGRAPYRRIALPSPETGVSGPCAVSSDGRWAAAAVAHAADLAIAFADLRGIRFLGER